MPATQFEQAEAPEAAASDPAPQPTHTVEEVAATTAEALPAGHEEHPEALVAAPNAPAAHGAQLVAPGTENIPAAQLAQVVDRNAPGVVP